MNIEDYFIFIYFLIGLDGETEGNVFMIFIYDLIKLKSNCTKCLLICIIHIDNLQCGY